MAISIPVRLKAGYQLAINNVDRAHVPPIRLRQRLLHLPRGEPEQRWGQMVRHTIQDMIQLEHVVL